MAQMVTLDCVHGLGLTLAFGGHQAVISTALWPNKIFAAELLIASTDYSELK